MVDTRSASRKPADLISTFTGCVSYDVHAARISQLGRGQNTTRASLWAKRAEYTKLPLPGLEVQG
eukprot:362457-Alexandrium_andersonii.AAC.1